jgi:uncharacterized RDD family membrane protein YckC
MRIIAGHLATRWARFFARIFDLWCEGFLAPFILLAASYYYSADFVEWIKGVPLLLFSFLCLPHALFLDAFLYRVFGNTPGKALLGLKVETLDRKPLSFRQYLNRNYSMWVSGLSLGIPLVYLCTMAYQYLRIGKGRQASYDESWEYRVRAKPIGWSRKLIFGFLFVSMFLIITVLNSIVNNVGTDHSHVATTLKNLSELHLATNLKKEDAEIEQRSSSNLFPRTSPLHEPYKNFTAKLSAIPEFKQDLQNASSEDQAFAITASLAQKGLRRLDDNSLKNRMGLLVMLLEKLDTETCALMIRGNIPQYQEFQQQFQQKFLSALGQLGPVAANEWFDLTLKAAVAEARGSPAPVSINEQKIMASMNNLLMRLSPADSKVLTNILINWNGSGSEDICWAGKTLYKEILKMDTADMSVLVRSFLSE